MENQQTDDIQRRRPTFSAHIPYEATGDSVRVHYEGERLVIEVTGNISFAALDALTSAFLAGAAENAPCITVDMTKVGFIDSSGLSLLVQHSKRFRTPECLQGLRVLVTAGRQPDRVLKMSGFDRIFEIIRIAKE